MTDVSPAVGTAGRTLTAFLNGAVIQLVLLVKEVELALVGVYMAVAAVSGRVYTVKEINAPVYCLQNVGRRSHAHKINRLFFRQMWNRHIQDMVHFLMGLSYRKSADGIAVQIHLPDRLCVLDTDLVNDAALVNTK